MQYVSLQHLSIFFLWVILPILAAYIYSKFRARQRAYDKLANELREEKENNIKVSSELAGMRESLDSINKMMKEIG